MTTIRKSSCIARHPSHNPATATSGEERKGGQEEVWQVATTPPLKDLCTSRPFNHELQYLWRRRGIATARSHRVTNVVAKTNTLHVPAMSPLWERDPSNMASKHPTALFIVPRGQVGVANGGDNSPRKSRLHCPHRIVMHHLPWY